MPRSLPSLLFCSLLINTHAQVCDPEGNLVIYSNYQGGMITINVDEDIPDMRIGICTYEAVAVTFTGTFVGNITEVIYAGFDGQNGPCGNNPPTTTIAGVPASIVTMYSNTLGNIGITNFLGQEVVPGFNVVNCMAGAEGECSISTQAGGNSAPQIVQFFLAEFGPGTSLFSHQVQYACFNNTFNVSEGGNCCLTETGTPPNPIHAGNATFDLFPFTDTLLCDGSLYLDVSFYTGIYSLVWNNGSEEEAITVTAPGTYSVSIADYCHVPGITPLITDTVDVLPCCDPGPVNMAVGAITCAGSNDGSITVEPLGPNAPFTYAWSTSPPQTTAGISDLGPGLYEVTITDATACDTTLIVVLEEPSAIDLAISGDSVLCSNESTTLTALATGGTGTLSIAWSTGASGSSINLSPSTTTTVTVTATDASGCTAQDALPLTVNDAVTASFTADATAICTGTGVRFTAQAPGADSLLWILGSAGTSDLVDPLVVFNEAGLETIGLTAYANACASEPFTATLPVSPSVQVRMEASAALCERTFDLSVNAVNADTCTIWLNGVPLDARCDDVHQISVASPGDQYVQVVAGNAGGCRDSTAIALRITDDVGLYVPNVFSPNNDGLNEEFGIPYLSEPNVFELLVLNRWGQEVYRSSKPSDTWKGAGMPEGVYLYILRTDDPCDPRSVRQLRGHVTLLR